MTRYRFNVEPLEDRSVPSAVIVDDGDYGSATLSRITIAAFADMGYAVNLDAADAY